MTAHRKTKGAFLCCLFLALNSSVSAQQKEDTSGFLAMMSDSLRPIHSLQADFVQKRILTVFMDTLTSSGTFYFQMPDRFRWEVRKDFHTLLISNGRQIAKFDFQNGRLRKLKPGTADLMREVLGQILHWIRGDFSESMKLYEITISRSPNMEIILIPKSEAFRETLSRIVLTVDKRNLHISQVSLYEPGLGITTMTFTNEKVNGPFPEGLFDTDHPVTGQ